MRMNKKYLSFIDWILAAAALVCLVPVFCPYSAIKSLGDSLASDGELESLTVQTVFVLRGVFALFFLIFAGMAPSGR